MEFNATLTEIVFMLRVVHPNRLVVLSLLLAAAAGVCSAQLVPFSTTDYAAKVITQTGQVSIVKDTQPWALSVGRFGTGPGLDPDWTRRPRPAAGFRRQHF